MPPRWVARDTDERPVDPKLSRGLHEFSKSRFKEERYSDLTIRCKFKHTDEDAKEVEHVEFYVHKMIVCLQSDFFANACKPDSPRRINLDGHAFMVMLMLETLYSNNMACEKFMKAHHSDLPEYEAELHCFAELYALGDKYQAPVVQKHAAERFESTLTAWFELDKKDPKRYPRRKVGLPILAKYVFETTPDSATALRNLIYFFTKTYLHELLKSSHFWSHMDVIDGFWDGFARFSTHFEIQKRCCPRCRRENDQAWEGDFWKGVMVVTCPKFTSENEYCVDEWSKSMADESESEDPESESESEEEEEEEGNHRKRQRCSSSQG
ncbi:uncharacterized protein J3D65DRAFT_667591 [Phyllosticta citribraziliensis]|uniref:BTB domain-containing protein n=1 Tax=Phyllosticta citribraziliensis TaxID=989973 RepID=A0ABR1LNX6_9PEZI